jgi:hypothetical protein
MSLPPWQDHLPAPILALRDEGVEQRVVDAGRQTSFLMDARRMHDEWLGFQ